MTNINEEFRAYQAEQTAYPVGNNKDSYTISCHVTIDPETDAMKYSAYITKNFHSSTRSERLMSGTIKECRSFVAEIVKEQGMFIDGIGWPKDSIFRKIKRYPVDQKIIYATKEGVYTDTVQEILNKYFNDLLTTTI